MKCAEAFSLIHTRLFCSLLLTVYHSVHPFKAFMRSVAHFLCHRLCCAICHCNNFHCSCFAFCKTLLAFTTECNTNLINGFVWAKNSIVLEASHSECGRAQQQNMQINRIKNMNCQCLCVEGNCCLLVAQHASGIYDIGENCMVSTQRKRI